MSLSAQRALQVLDFLTANERGTFTLSELSKALDVSPGSMFAVLKAMSEGGYVTRHPRHKTYTLGPAVAAAGHAASGAHPVIELARTEMVKLAAATGHECTGTVLVGSDILVIAVEGEPSGQSLDLAPGQRIPLLPPFGQPFMAWMPPAELREWIADLPDDLRDRVAGYIESYGRIVRQRGYSVGRGVPGREHHSLTRELSARPNDSALRAALLQRFFAEQPEFAVSEFELDTEYHIGNIAAPVFDPEGRVACCLTLLNIGTRTGREVPAAARPVIASAQLLTRQISGRVPQQD
ncbi:IclR family transcriptional regulator [Nocardia sp. NPDC051750]|uniref:IclR family transcriptional regulator n=1 Tax=Nocardia sp. NPDC051750 TaxID=3364325 RepID=UPI0037922B16